MFKSLIFNVFRALMLTALMVVVLPSCSKKQQRVVRRPPPKRITTSSATVTKAKALIGAKYKYGGASKSGFDCSGLVYYVHRELGQSVPRTSRDQAKRGQRVSLSQTRPGDLIFFGHGGKVSHVGIVSATGGRYPTMIHASSSKGVQQVDIDRSEYWQRRLMFVRRW